MIGLLQRVAQAEVEVEGVSVGKMGPGRLVLVCAEREAEADRLLERLRGVLFQPV